ncbi:aldehyde dehydrogenase family protein [Salimicrobium halophilum]|uniref:Aldehyde dehydrogenase family protein n=1 Tax=Salimicrobium halophilum TaxID=86666 RepID=A0A1G8TMR5_9BACI|nr:aldehyde dehydrogenase family protein [Salimicrobium halophilum]SDJ42694.1 Aldehyde dehydrogenase family protein [Salimicrobium halophilum]
MTHQPVTMHAFVDGKHLETEDSITRENPANPEEIVGYAPLNTIDDTRHAVDVADQAFQKWRHTEISDRVERMKRAISKLRESQEEITGLLSREHGKPVYDANGEMEISIMWMEHACSMAEDLLKDEVKNTEDGQTIIAKDPIGVVSAISPWNYPIALSTIKVAPALLAGNTIIVKPSPLAPLAVQKVLEIIASEFPAGVLNSLNGEADIGVELTSNEKVSKIAFTGGTATGRKIMESAADTIKELTLELGGNDPALILPSFDPNDEKAMRRLVISNFVTAGEICMIAKRIYVPQSMHDEFVEKYKEAADKWIRVGDPSDENVTLGPVNNKEQVEFVQELVDDAKANGAEVTKLGKIMDEELFDQGYYMQPTLVTGVNHDSRIVGEEQFGPTIPIVAYEDVDEGVDLCNDSIFGLTSSVWGEEEEALQVARRIEAGTTMINTAAIQGLDVRYAFGGVKQSGLGREYGEEGLTSYVNTHVINNPNEKDLPFIPE